MLTSENIATNLIFSVRTAEGEYPIGEAAGWQIEIGESDWSGPGKQVHLCATWAGRVPTRAGLVVHRPLPGAAPQRVLMPSVFYEDNGSGGPATLYPRLGALNAKDFTAPGWDFASERMALPAVFAWDQQTVQWLAVEPNGSGVGFSAQDEAGELRVHCPGLELPFRYDRTDESAYEPLTDVAPGESLELAFWYGEQSEQAGGAARTVAVVQRSLQSAWGGAAARPIDAPRVEAAASAAAEGLLSWHYRRALGYGYLAEAISFDRAQLRDEMHVAWISGAPAAYALLRYGQTRADSAAAEAARAVIDTVVSELTPCGTFWGIWTPRGWRSGWNGHPQKLHARTLAEATLFITRALTLEAGHARWAAAVASNLDFCLRCMDASGHPGSYYHALNGRVLDRRGTAGLLWVAALAEGAAVLKTPRYLAAALQMGEAYADAIRQGELLGAPEDIGLCPSSEDAYNALIAMMALHTATGDAKWLALAKSAADWLLTYRWSYDVRFPASTPLARRGFQTRGADSASPSNHHLHNYGLICQAELFRLSHLLHDPWYAARATDHLACFVGEVAVADHKFGGAECRGMMSEQWYTANWSVEGRAGHVAPISHAWCLAFMLMAAEDWLDRQAGSELQTSGRVVRRFEATVAEPKHVKHSESHALVPDAWHPVRLLPGLYQVGGGYLRHGRDASNFLILDENGGDCFMVDCGSHCGLDTVRANIAQVTDLKRLKLVIGTHCHWDHVEAFSHLRQETGAQFAIHELDAGPVRSRDPDLTWARFLYNELFHPFPVDIELKGGEHFKIGNYQLEIMHLPGHSPGSIAVKATYVPAGFIILIPGDCIEGAFGKRIHSNTAAWKSSMRRLMSERIDFMLPSHLPSGAQTALLSDVPNRLARVYRRLETDFHAFMDRQ